MQQIKVSFRMTQQLSGKKRRMTGSAGSAAGESAAGSRERVPQEARPTVLCPSSVDSSGLLRQTGRLLRAPQQTPVPCLLWAAGFNFGRALELLDLVPYDPHLNYIFFGEEESMAARLYTHGFDCFAPPEAVIYHLWTRDHRPTFQMVKPPNMCSANMQ